YENCAVADAKGLVGTETYTDSADDCAETKIIPTSGTPGVGPGFPILAGKAWDQSIVRAQSRTVTGATLTWGVQVSGYESVAVTDNPNPSAATVASSAFQTFDLVRIDAI